MKQIESYLMAIGVIIAGLIVIFFIATSSKDYKKEYLEAIPFRKSNLLGSLLDKPAIKDFLDDVMKANGRDDSLKKVGKDVLMSSGIGLCIFMVMATFNYAAIGAAIGIACLTLPFITRIMDKKKFKKKYLADFYEFLNYIILHVSGGVPVDKALVEVEALIDDKSLIKDRLKNIVAQRAVSGLSGNTYVDALRDLNKGLDYTEINLFISAANRSAERGDAMTESLLEQLSDIQKKVNIEKRGRITSAESTFNAYQVILCLVPVLFLFAVPIFVNGIMQLAIF